VGKGEEGKEYGKEVREEWGRGEGVWAWEGGRSGEGGRGEGVWEGGRGEECRKGGGGGEWGRKCGRGVRGKRVKEGEGK
jgi:hypothetical protein